MIAMHVPLVTQSQVTEQCRTCQCLKGPFNSHWRYVKIQAKLPREICYLIATAEDNFTRMNIDYKFLCNSSSVDGNENCQDKSSLVGDDDIENCQNKDVGIENHLSSDSIGGMKNRLLNNGCLLMTHFQPVYVHADIEKSPSKK